MCQYIRSLQGKFTEIWYAKFFGYLQICTHFEYSRDNNLEKKRQNNRQKQNWNESSHEEMRENIRTHRRQPIDPVSTKSKFKMKSIIHNIHLRILHSNRRYLCWSLIRHTLTSPQSRRSYRIKPQMSNTIYFSYSNLRI